MTDIEASGNIQQEASEDNTTKNQKQQQQHDAVIEDLKAQNMAMKGKLEELLGETKKAKQQARLESEEKERVKLEKAKKDGDYEQMLKSSEKERTELLSKFTELNNKIASEKVKSESLKIASELADGNNIDLLSEFINKRLKYTDEGVKVLNTSGEMTVSTIDELKREFQNSDKFQSLLRGSKAKGGDAQGSGNSVATKGQKIVDRASFDKMSQLERANHIRSGGRVTD